MKKNVRIGDKPPHPMYIPKELIEDGFIGDVVLLPNACTATIVRPGTSLEDVSKSLKRTLEDVEHRIAMGMQLFEEENGDKEEKKEEEQANNIIKNVKEESDRLEVKNIDKSKQKIEETAEKILAREQ